jgi:hypothetical protein
MGEMNYSSYSFLTSALDGVSGQRHGPAALYPRYPLYRRSRVSSVSIVSDYGLDDWAIEVRSPAGAKDFSSILCVQTGSEAHPASCTMGTGGPFPGGKSAAGA